MILSAVDWTLIIGFFIISLGIGIAVAKQSGKNTSEFFLSGRNMPWWLLGISMVATTFSADTPNLVTDIVRKNGVAGNWAWWAFLVTGMLTVFVYAKLWRRSGIITDLEFYELRYSGRGANFLRGFRAFYLGVLFNVLVMATVCLAAIKIGSVLLNLSPVQTLLIASIITVIYSTLGGLKGIILTDFFQFIIAMIGTVWAAIIIVNLPEIGGLDNLLSHDLVAGKIDLIPDPQNTELFVSLLIIPLAVQWWAAYYPGAEPGGGGYIVQRMLAAKDEKNAIGATLLFNFAHYALRPWPWILIALASLIVFPSLESIQTAFPNVDPAVINDDLAYSAMLTYLPSGVLGLVIASLIAAFMSTISTHLNWGSSYIANDFYKLYYNKEASESELVLVGRISTIILMIIAAILALYLENAKKAFDIIVLMGAGTGLIFILRWFWWRINAYSEISALIVSFLLAIVFKFLIPGTFASHIELILGVAITTIAWITITFLTRPTEKGTLVKFYEMIKPHSYGWSPIIKEIQRNPDSSKIDQQPGKLVSELLSMISGIFLVYGLLFTVGYILYGNFKFATLGSVICLVSAVILWKNWKGSST